MSTSLLSGFFSDRHLLSAAVWTKNDIETVITSALRFQQTPSSSLLKGKILASCFFEPSTRTRLSFEGAMLRLGGQVIGFSDGNSTSLQKGETLSDTIRVIGEYADLLVLRHPSEDATAIALEATSKPVINAGDGANEHPSQMLVDLFTMNQIAGRLDGQHIALCGDLKHGRAIRSLALGLSCYNVRLYFISPSELSLSEEIASILSQRGISFSCHTSFEEILHQLDFLYMIRLQTERLSSSLTSILPTLSPHHLKEAKNTLRILHPLPRSQEIDCAIDSTPYAAYFLQAANAIAVRQALLALCLGGL